MGTDFVNPPFSGSRPSYEQTGWSSKRSLAKGRFYFLRSSGHGRVVISLVSGHSRVLQPGMFSQGSKTKPEGVDFSQLPVLKAVSVCMNPGTGLMVPVPDLKTILSINDKNEDTRNVVWESFDFFSYIT